MAVTTRQRLERARRLLTVQEQMRGIAERDLAATRRDLARVEADRAAMLTTLAGETMRAADMDLTARVISNGIPHQALPLTATLCLAVTARLAGSVVHDVIGDVPERGLRVGMPSGILTADAAVEASATGWSVTRGSFFRTARPLMKGHVFA